MNYAFSTEKFDFYRSLQIQFSLLPKKTNKKQLLSSIVKEWLSKFVIITNFDFILMKDVYTALALCKAYLARLYIFLKRKKDLIF